MKKYKLSYGLAVFFTAGFLVSFRYFDKEAAGMLILFALIAFISGVVNFKINR